MKRAAFYRQYYEITNRLYSDHIIWSAEDRKQARRRGQINTSKTERAIFIAVQYMTLLASGLFFSTGKDRYGMLGCMMFLLYTLLTDFSFLKIEMLYHIFFRNNPYSTLLYQSFAGKADDFWCLVLPQVKKQISGFVRINRNKFVAKYHVAFRKKRENVTIIITPSRIRIKAEKQCFLFDDPTMSLAQIADALSEVFKSM